MSAQQPPRLGVLKMYLGMLAADMNAAGKFQGAGDDKITATIDAIFSGTSATAKQLAADLKTLGGEGIALGKPIVENFLSGLAARAIQGGVTRVVEEVAVRVDGSRAKRKDQQQVGAAFMKAAENLGKRPGR